MKRGVKVLLMGVIFSSSVAWGQDNFFIIVNGGQTHFDALSGFPGRYWGSANNVVTLSGQENALNWLAERNILNRSVPLDEEWSSLYFCYYDHRAPDMTGALIGGDDFVISATPAPGADFCRRLTPGPLPPVASAPTGEIILIYDPLIDTLIQRVSEDSIVAYLSKLSGDSPININGGLDTIRTRYSGTSDNRIAAQFLRETLESYGYQTEYHGFYGGALRHVAVYDHDRAWAVTEDSEALRTTDGGVTWETVADDASAELWGVENAGPDSVWLSGNYGTVRFSADGGSSFVIQTASVGSFLFGIDFINSSEGWIAADLGRIIHTTNAGQNWATQTTPVGSRLYDVCFVDSQYGWAVGRDGSIVHTTNGGGDWTRQTSNTTQRLYGVKFTDRNNGWVVGWGGVVLHTSDGGSIWNPVDLGSNVEKYHVDFCDSLHGLIVGWNGEIFVTSDAGTVWEQMPSNMTKDLYGVDYGDGQTAVAVGSGVILTTSDAGQTWADRTSGVESAWRNVVATKPGSVSPGQQVIVCGHMDDTSEQPQVRAPGADDNGSGTAGVIEAARVFRDFNFEKTIKFCLWTGEEQGLLGSAAYAADAAGRGDTIAGVYNFDMIAWDGNGDGSIELHCGTMPSSQAIGHIFEDVITDYGLSLDPEFLTWNSTDRSDHASFWDHGFPAILGIEDFSSDFNPYYHTTNDNMSIINEAFFTEFVKAGVGAAATLAMLDTANVAVGDDVGKPDLFVLHGNYPNPFNASTIISFTLTAPSDVRLSVFDVTGRKVATLYNRLAVAGKRAVRWDAGEAASGIYLYRLETDSGKAVGRMTLIK